MKTVLFHLFVNLLDVKYILSTIVFNKLLSELRMRLLKEHIFFLTTTQKGLSPLLIKLVVILVMWSNPSKIRNILLYATFKSLIDSILKQLHSGAP